MTRTQISLAALALALAAGAGGFALSRALPSDPPAAAANSEADGHTEDEAKRETEGDVPEGIIAADAAQIRAAGIEIARVSEQPVSAEVLASGTLIPATDATGHVTDRKSVV